MTVSEAEKYIGEKHFAEGSMLPKVMAAIEFLKSPGESAQKSAVISLLSKARDALEGLTGTRIVR
jgi:carbamate kinase